jgi:hypothetical protein
MIAQFEGLRKVHTSTYNNDAQSSICVVGELSRILEVIKKLFCLVPTQTFWSL